MIRGVDDSWDLMNDRYSDIGTLKDRATPGSGTTGNHDTAYTAQAPNGPKVQSAFQSFPVMAAIPVAKSLAVPDSSLDGDGRSNLQCSCSVGETW